MARVRRKTLSEADQMKVLIHGYSGAICGWHNVGPLCAVHDHIPCPHPEDLGGEVRQVEEVLVAVLDERLHRL